MKKPPVADGRLSNEPTLRPPSTLPFRIVGFEHVSYGKKIVVAKVAIDGFGTVNIEGFADDDAGVRARPASIAAKYGMPWQRTVEFSPEFEQSLSEALLARVENDDSTGGFDD